MTTHQDYNIGPIVSWLGHGNTCNQTPTKLMNLGSFNAISMSSKREGGVYSLVVRDHNNILAEFVQWVKTLHYAGETEVIASLIPRIHKKAKIKYMQYVSQNFKPIMEDKDALLPGGYKITINNTSYDIRSFIDRFNIMNLPKSILPDAYSKKIKDFQQEHMSYKADSIVYCWELRERIISYPYNILVKPGLGEVPPASDYLKLSYKLKQLRDHKGVIQQSIYIQVYVSKEALKDNILNHNQLKLVG